MIDRSCDLTQDISTLHANEQLKANSQNLRGNIAEGLENSLTGAVPGDDPLLMKFHGIYQQDDRDLRADRNRRKLEPNYQFMVRMRIPGGVLSKAQWQGIDALSRRHAERGIRITTRQTIQLHGVRKPQLRALMQGIRDLGLDTIAACGDDSRGVVCGSNPSLSNVHHQVANLARETSNRLIPKTGAYPQIWYQEDRPPSDNEDPMYGPLYLPRKFKVGYVIPPVNDIDVYGQDLGLIAIVEKGQLQGFNVCFGGGMGQLDSRQDSYPRLAEQLGFIPADEAPAFAEIVMASNAISATAKTATAPASNTPWTAWAMTGFLPNWPSGVANHWPPPDRSTLPRTATNSAGNRAMTASGKRLCSSKTVALTAHCEINWRGFSSNTAAGYA